MNSLDERPQVFFPVREDAQQLLGNYHKEDGSHFLHLDIFSNIF